MCLYGCNLMWSNATSQNLDLNALKLKSNNLKNAVTNELSWFEIFCKSEEVAASTKTLILWLRDEYNEFFDLNIGFSSETYYLKLWPAAVAVDHMLGQIEKMITGFTKMKKTFPDGSTKIVARPIREALKKKFVTSTQNKKRLHKIPIDHKFPGNYLKSIA